MSFFLGQSFSGGTVFNIDAGNNIAYIVSVQILYGNPLSIGTPQSSSTGDAIGDGADNTQYLKQFSKPGDILDSVYTSGVWAGYNDWHIPSIGELHQIYGALSVVNMYFQDPTNSHSDTNGFNDNVYYYSSSVGSDGNLKVLNGATGSLTSELSPFGTLNAVMYIRQQPTDGGGITISDGDITIYEAVDVIDFSQIVISDVVTEEISYATNRENSCLICSTIDMTKLAEGFEATPSSLFGNLPNILSAHTKDGKSWYKDTTLTGSLTTIATGVVYQLMFSQDSSGILEIRGERISYPYTYTIPSGESWFPYLNNVDMPIYSRTGGFFTRAQFEEVDNIINHETGLYYPGFNLLEKNKGYTISTSSSFDVIFE